MGIEPTGRMIDIRPNDFEDRGRHQPCKHFPKDRQPKKGRSATSVDKFDRRDSPIRLSPRSHTPPQRHCNRWSLEGQGSHQEGLTQSSPVRWRIRAS